MLQPLILLLLSECRCCYCSCLGTSSSYFSSSRRTLCSPFQVRLPLPVQRLHPLTSLPLHPLTFFLVGPQSAPTAPAASALAMAPQGVHASLFLFHDVSMPHPVCSSTRPWACRCRSSNPNTSACITVFDSIFSYSRTIAEVSNSRIRSRVEKGCSSGFTWAVISLHKFSSLHCYSSTKRALLGNFTGQTVSCLL